jgi:hypothetical protein
MKPETQQSIELTVLDFYVKTGAGLSVPEITARVPWGETTVRRAAQESERLELTHKFVQVMSKNYPGHLHQERSIDAYQPTRRWLREVITKLKEQAMYGDAPYRERERYYR